jgi:predicted ATP-grasp superfamily ATP-dependent carboligase
VLPSTELVEDLTDKVRFFALARRHDLLVPDTLAVPVGGGASKVLQHWDHFPCVCACVCVCKPTMRTENRYEFTGSYQKALHIETRGDLESLLPKIEASNMRFLIQASVEGGEENIVSYHAYVRPSGEIVAEFTGHKVRTAPKLYGRSTYVEITNDREVRDLGRATVAKLGFSGSSRSTSSETHVTTGCTCSRSIPGSTSGTIQRPWPASASRRQFSGTVSNPERSSR